MASSRSSFGNLPMTVLMSKTLTSVFGFLIWFGLVFLQMRLCWIVWKRPDKLRELQKSKYLIVRWLFMNPAQFDDDSLEYLWLARVFCTFVTVVMTLVFVAGNPGSGK